MTDQTPMTNEQLVTALNTLSTQIQSLTQNQQDLLTRVAAAKNSAADGFPSARVRGVALASACGSTRGAVG